ncbi:Adaptor protein complex 4 (AP-4), beta subunit [Blattamonas nauphoetae]|uniref:AP complex subunit beta n=1 Tax=Blattamonas nauphoetae TaxID=2049346 RepID=A0ABQ9XMS4_9EUKA|nr:Adaptor protein complex 4 (AP-4), beta subunit [Blattamonas nauphoetae]
MAYRAEEKDSKSAVQITKGEVTAIRAILKDSEIMRNPKQRQHTFSRVMFYVSQGINMSPLFSDMIIHAATKDFVEKKLIYQYLTYYAPSNEDKALLCINTFQKDFQSNNPQIRGLALKSLSSLRVQSLNEYIIPCITAGLTDMSPYVRSVAVIACLKTFYFARDFFDEQKYLEKLFEMARDSDPTVSGNCISALNELLGFTTSAPTTLSSQHITKSLIIYLLGRLDSYNEWHMQAVLRFVKRYKPTSEDEMFDIMNLLDIYFRSNNAGLVIAVAEIFLEYSSTDSQLSNAVIKRLVDPLITMVISGNPEVAFVAIKFILSFEHRLPGSFVKHHQVFYFKWNDPVYLKQAKLTILREIVNEQNWRPILQELEQYSIDALVGAQVIDTIGFVGIKIPDSFGVISRIITDTLQFEQQSTTSAAIITVRDILRRYPSAYPQFIPLIGQHFYSFETNEAKCALIFLIGHFGEHIPSSPYLLEPFVERVADELSEANPLPFVDIHISLLNATTRLFFFRPKEVQPLLGKLLGDIISTAAQGVVRDSALVVYRMLSQPDGYAKTQSVFAPDSIAESRFQRMLSGEEEGVALIGASFAEEEAGTQDEVWREWGSLSTVYNHPEDYFTRPPVLSVLFNRQLRQAEKEATVRREHEERAKREQAEKDRVEQEELARRLAEQALVSEPQFLRKAACSPQDFQRLWKELPEAASEELPLSDPIDVAEWKGKVDRSEFTLIACGGNAQNLKMFIYGKSSSADVVLADVRGNGQTEMLTCTVHSKNEDLASQFAMSILTILTD